MDTEILPSTSFTVNVGATESNSPVTVFNQLLFLFLPIKGKFYLSSKKIFPLSDSFNKILFIYKSYFGRFPHFPGRN